MKRARMLCAIWAVSMARLWRPHIPLRVRCQVAAQQLGTTVFVEHIFREEKEPSGKFLRRQLAALARKLGCEVKDLRLDHDPPLAARPQFRRGLGKKTYYEPDANDPDHLFYRPHGPEFDRSHLIKTNVRGDHGQFPDRVLIKRERRRRSKKPKKSHKWGSRPLRSGSRWPKGRKIQNRKKGR